MSLSYFGIKIKPKFGDRSRFETYQDILYASRFFDEDIPKSRLVGLCNVAHSKLSEYLKYGEEIGHFKNGIIQKDGIECNQTWNSIQKIYGIKSIVSSVFVEDLSIPVVTGNDNLLNDLFKFGRVELSPYIKKLDHEIRFSSLIGYLNLLFFLIAYKKSAPFVYEKLNGKIQLGSFGRYKKFVKLGLENGQIELSNNHKKGYWDNFLDLTLTENGPQLTEKKKKREIVKISATKKAFELKTTLEHFISKYHMEPYFTHFIRE